MSTNFRHLFYSILIFLAVCISALAFISPYSLVSFIGPAAGISTALVILWGTGMLITTTLAVVMFLVTLHFYFNIEFSLAMAIITLLSILLQSYWAKQLSLREVHQQQWLKSRKSLLLFLFKLGPLASIVSATAAVIISILGNETLHGHLLYTFISTWTVSILLTIFFAPTFLLLYGRQQLSASKRLFIIIASLLALVAIGLLFKTSQNYQQQNRQNTFTKVKENITQKLTQEIKITFDELISVSALFQTKNNINQAEFEFFSEKIIHKNSSLVALEWAPIINHNIRGEFEQQATNIIDYNPKGYMQPASIRGRYAPINFIYPIAGNEVMLGFDVLNNPEHVISMEKVISSHNVMASAPIHLIQEQFSSPSVLFINAVFLPENVLDKKAEMSANTQGQLIGFVVAVLQFENFFQKIAPLKSDNVALFIEDISVKRPYVLFGRELQQGNRQIETLILNVYSRQWRISLGERQPWQMQERSWQTWGMLLGAAMGGMLFQLLILMMAAYSSELSVQVVRKTRELIIAKEESEQKSLAKTNFLNTLHRDLQTPLQAIGNFIQELQHEDATSSIKTINNINLAQQNMSKLLSMVFDLSKIEMGNLELQQDTFDLHGFLTRIDSMLKAKLPKQKTNISFLVDESVPHFIDSDELRIQQILVVLCDEIHAIFNNNNIRLSIKLRHHRHNSGTLMLVFTSHDNNNPSSLSPFMTILEKGISKYSTQLSVIKDVCQFMGGNVNLAVSMSGGRILTASIKVKVSSLEQQRAFQAQVFDKN